MIKKPMIVLMQLWGCFNLDDTEELFYFTAFSMIMDGAKKTMEGCSYC